MIFYKIPATADEPARLEPTQDAARAACKARRLRFKAADMQHDVPTDKGGLLAYVNDLLADAGEAAANAPRTAMDAPPAKAVGFMTRDDVAAAFTPQATAKSGPAGWGDSLHSAELTDRLQGGDVDVGRRVDRICDDVGELGGFHLGNVAHAVAARFNEIARRAQDLTA